MNGAHLHLIVTHLPVLGVAFGAVLLAIGWFRDLELHEEAGLVGLVMAGLASGVALVALASGWKGRPLSRGLVALTLVIALVAGGTLAWVANLGGQIGHPEIRSGQTAPPGERDERADSP